MTGQISIVLKRCLKLKNGNVVIGYTSRITPMVDIDSQSLKKVKWVSMLAMKHFKLEGFIILNSSKYNYHVVFNKPLKFEDCLRVAGWIGIMLNNPHIWKWVSMQAIKQSMTLRISPKKLSKKKVKKRPEVAFEYGRKDKCISKYLNVYKWVQSNFY